MFMGDSFEIRGKTYGGRLGSTLSSGADPENNLTGFQFTHIIYTYMCLCVLYMYHIYHIHAGVRQLWCLAAFVSLYYNIGLN